MQSTYRPVSQDDEDGKSGTRTARTTHLPRWKQVAIGIVGCINIGLCIALAMALQAPCSRMACLRQVSVYSPALKGIYYEDVTLQNTFNEPSVYRGPPTRELEDAWHQLYRFGLIAIPDSEMHRLNKTGSEDVHRYERVPDTLGGGYRAMPDVLHQLHCLNMLRQYTWLAAPGPPHYGAGSRQGLAMPHSLRAGAVGNRMHVDHCIETIRKVLMCHADVTPLLDMVVEGDGNGDGNGTAAHPPARRGDFNVFTRCRDFARLQAWLRDNMVIPFDERVEDTP